MFEIRNFWLFKELFIGDQKVPSLTVQYFCHFLLLWWVNINCFERDILFLVPANFETLPPGLLLRNILHLLKESYLHFSHFPHAQWKPRGIFLVPSVLHFFGLSKSLMLQRWILILISSLISFHTNHGLRTPNEGINQSYLKNWADVADKICFGRT